MLNDSDIVLESTSSSYCPASEVIYSCIIGEVGGVYNEDIVVIRGEREIWVEQRQLKERWETASILIKKN